MKKLLCTGGALAALILSATQALALGHKNACDCCCTCEAAPAQTVVLRVNVTQRTCPVEVPVVNPAIVHRTEGFKDMPCTKSVPVCVTDPCTGCTHTEYKQETVIERVKTVNIEILPPAPGCGKKIEQRVNSCVTIEIDHVPCAGH
jgi:hypothetical protein